MDIDSGCPFPFSISWGQCFMCRNEIDHLPTNRVVMVNLFFV